MYHCLTSYFLRLYRRTRIDKVYKNYISIVFTIYAKLNPVIIGLSMVIFYARMHVALMFFRVLHQTVLFR